MMEKASGKTAFTYAGFVQKDFDADRHAIYEGKIRELAAKALAGI